MAAVGGAPATDDEIDIADPNNVISAGDWVGPGAAVDGAATGAAINRAAAGPIPYSARQRRGRHCITMCRTLTVAGTL